MSTTTQRAISDLPEFGMAEYDRDPFPLIEAARAQGDLARSWRGVEVLSYDLNLALLGDERLRTPQPAEFAADGATELILSFIQDGIFLFMDDERHRRVRKVFARAFAVRRIDQHRDLMAAVAERIYRERGAAGDFDATEDFTSRFAIEVLCRVIGVPPEDIPRFAAAANDLRAIVHIPIVPHVPKLEAALTMLHDYVSDLLAERRGNPQSDYLTDLVDAERHEGTLSPAELTWGVVNLLLAGYDTTNYQLAWAIYEFTARDVWHRLRDEPQLLESALHELVRYRPVARVSSRIARSDTVIDDTFIPAGQRLMLNTLAAGRDPVTFPDPETFDITRTPQEPAIVFGAGIHFCIGHALAWAEMTTALQLLARELDHPTLGEVVLPTWAEPLGGPTTLTIHHGA